MFFCFIRVFSLAENMTADDAQKFWKLVKAGRELADIHLRYETQELPAQVEVIGGGNYRKKTLRFAKDDKTTLIYNERSR